MSSRIGSRLESAWLWASVACLLLAATLKPSSALAQRLSFGQVRPFVTGFIPVVGPRGAVGGVLVDAGGVVERAEVEEHGRLREAWQAALQPLSADLSRPAPLRKISLRRLEEALAQHLAEKKPLTDEMNFLAGLRHVRYVFVYPEQRDIVLAGPAEGWRVTQHGALVGQTTGRPVLMLEDLLVALRSADAAAESGILCSIDPTEEGLARLKRLLRSRAGPTNALIEQMGQTLGPQVVTVQGVPADSRFARVMVAADFLMKRLAMGFEPAPVNDLPSYLQLVAASRAAPPRTVTPRWWLAPEYAPLRRDTDGLAWEIGRRSIQTLSDEGAPTPARIASEKALRRPATLAQQWADQFTLKYEELAAHLPVFAELQNCMDLAVVAALVAKEELGAAADFEMSLLLDATRLPTGSYPAPQLVPSQASAVAKGTSWIVSVSGGVEIDPQQIARQAEKYVALTKERTQAIPPAQPRWWWD